MKKSLKNYDDLNVTEKRISYLLGARLRETDRVKNAMKKQDGIRKKHPAPEGWDSASVIRSWRETR
ncbi:MAG: hypothetical protein AB1426_06155 [Bacillota bacterium]